MLEIMKEYGWDYYQYGKQPKWVLDLAVEKMKIESKKAQEQAPNK
jgi:hypothetical protein